MTPPTDTPKPPSQHHVAVRLDDAAIARLDALVARLSTDWHPATRSDVLRAVILRGLDLLEREPIPDEPPHS